MRMAMSLAYKEHGVALKCLFLSLGVSSKSSRQNETAIRAEIRSGAKRKRMEDECAGYFILERNGR